AGHRPRPDPRVARTPDRARRGRALDEIGGRLFPRELRMKPIFLICEDGTEYQDRLERFLGSEFRFVRADSFSALVAALDAHGAAAGLVLDLDFRRTPAEQLVDEAGASIALHEKARVAALQGLFILRA